MSTPEFRKIILIGLGGTGQSIVLRLKRAFLDTYDVVPPSVKLLCLDTDAVAANMKSQVYDRNYSLDPQEYIHTSVEQPDVFIRSMKSVERWFVTGGPMSAIVSGASAVRQNGRLALFHHLHDFERRLDNLKTSLDAADLPRKMEIAPSRKAKSGNEKQPTFILSGRPMEIYVCGSLAGGTGSGIFLDVGILLREQFPNALVHGFFLLNWLFRNDAFSYRIGGNVYSALAELDYLQSVGSGSLATAPYEVDYGTKKVVVSKPPYTLFHLIDGRNENGQNINDRGKVCEIVARAIFLSVGTMGNQVTSVVDNLRGHISTGMPKLWNGKHARYSSLGVSSIYYPAEKYARRLARESALHLCREAQREVAGGTNQAGAATTTPPAIAEGVDKWLATLGYPGTPTANEVRRAAKTFTMPEPERYDLGLKDFADRMINRLQAREKSQLDSIQGAAQAVEATHLAPKLESLDRWIAEIEKNPDLTGVTKRQYRNCARGKLADLIQDAATTKEAKAREVAELRKATQQAIDTARQASAGFLGGHRKGLAAAWAESATRMLAAVAELQALEHEAGFLQRMLARIDGRASLPAASASRIGEILAKVEEILVLEENSAKKEVDTLETNPTDIVLGHGSIICPDELAERLRATAQVKSEPGLGLSPCLRLDLFKTDKGIRVPDDYVTVFKGDANTLAAAFRDYADAQLAPFAGISVRAALKHFAAESGKEVEVYVREKFRDLFRLASPLWSFNRARVDSAGRASQYDKIINIGIDDEESGRAEYDQTVVSAKAEFRANAPHTFTTTGDRSHIWLLNYAAALPAYCLDTAEENRLGYLEAMSPPYHLDRFFEMNLPDIFPADDGDSVALRALGMAIVPDIDLIRDDKQGSGQGHIFTLADPEMVKSCYQNTPTTWHLFRDLYQEFCPSTYAEGSTTDAPNRGRQLLNTLVERLRLRLASKSIDDTATLGLGDLRDTLKMANRLRSLLKEDRELHDLADQHASGLTALLDSFDGRTAPSEKLEALMVKFLNGLRDHTAIEDLGILKEVKLEEPLSKLASEKPALGTQERARLNRSLLQKILADEKAKTAPLRRSLLCASVQTAIETYISSAKEKVDSRRFSRLISARLTYQELKALKTFLKPAASGGWDRDIDRYLAGR
jgi:hypothetical protein